MQPCSKPSAPVTIKEVTIHYFCPTAHPWHMYTQLCSTPCSTPKRRRCHGAVHAAAPLQEAQPPGISCAAVGAGGPGTAGSHGEGTAAGTCGKGNEPPSRTSVVAVSAVLDATGSWSEATAKDTGRRAGSRQLPAADTRKRGDEVAPPTSACAAATGSITPEARRRLARGAPRSGSEAAGQAMPNCALVGQSATERGRHGGAGGSARVGDICCTGSLAAPSAMERGRHAQACPGSSAHAGAACCDLSTPPTSDAFTTSPKVAIMRVCHVVCVYSRATPRVRPVARERHW